MGNSVKKIIPSGIKENIKRSFVNLSDKLAEKAEDMRYKEFWCPVCNNEVTGFLPFVGFEKYQKYQYKHSIFALETFNFLHYWCPKCKANDRDRLYALYLNKVFADLDKNKKYNFIEFAPETKSLAKFIKGHSFLNYRSADLYLEGVDDKVDIQDMNIYADEYADFFICSHILEHVDDDKKAMREFYRILKPSGWGVLMVPIQLNIDVIDEDPAIVDPGERWKHFGQDHHVRVYSKQGFVGRLKEAGFKVTELDQSFFGAESFRKSGIHSRSVLYVVTK